MKQTTCLLDSSPIKRIIQNFVNRECFAVSNCKIAETDLENCTKTFWFLLIIQFSY